MKQLWILVMLMALLVMPPGMAGADDTDGFWNHLIKKINKIVSSRPRGKTYTSVVGVRGAENDSDNSLYWKGETEPEGAGADPLSDEDAPEMFRAAVTFAMDGKETDALRIFREFMASYPDSELMPDAAAAVAKLEADMDGTTGTANEREYDVMPTGPDSDTAVNAATGQEPELLPAKTPETSENVPDDVVPPVDGVVVSDLPEN
ncbi:MAG: tetratricopeptide repeat protein [Thermodesulfobacteriota bacterium]|nr:tetratricopeptide repeat protein [Thermodesulfobacteriota bacterium]